MRSSPWFLIRRPTKAKKAGGSYDHRILDGALGGTFVRRVADYLESFDINRDI
jgi:pyruvate/2-oxoglutarate dehydrogenase complex dihydrolipoamide acyltransferase (E2) component